MSPPAQPHKAHGMYKVKRSLSGDGSVNGAIIPLSNIRQSCHLFPKFDNNDALCQWSASTALDTATSFYVNNWLNSYAYQTIW